MFVKHNFPKAVRGDTWGPFPLTINETGRDFTGVVIKMMVRDSDDVLLSTHTPTPTVGTGTVSCNLTATATQTKAWVPGKVYYDIELTYNDGRVFTVMSGTITVEKDYTYV